MKDVVQNTAQKSIKNLKFNLMRSGPTKGVGAQGTPVTGADIVAMVMAYISKLQTMNPDTDPSTEEIAISFDLNGLEQSIRLQSGTVAADEVLGFFGVANAGTNSERMTMILLPRSNGKFIPDDSQQDLQYIAYESWDPYIGIHADATQDDLNSLFIVSGS